MYPAGVVVIRRLRDKPRLGHQLNGNAVANLDKGLKARVGLAAVLLINLAVEEGHPKAGLLLKLAGP
jgi:hypothetical protein